MPPKKKSWANSKGKLALKKCLRDGVITEDMSPDIAFMQNEVIAEGGKDGRRLFPGRMKAEVKREKTKKLKAAEDSAAFALDHGIFPKSTTIVHGEPQWQG